MSRVDCKNCGAEYGIEYGACAICTPRVVMEARLRLRKGRIQAAILWEKSPLYLAVKEVMKHERKQFIQNECRDLQYEFLELLEKHRPERGCDGSDLEKSRDV
jgi:hypothetical protein